MNKNKLERIVRLMDEQGCTYDMAKEVVEAVDTTSCMTRDGMNEMETPEKTYHSVISDTDKKYRDAKKLIDEWTVKDLNGKQSMDIEKVKAAKEYISDYEKIMEKKRLSNMDDIEFRSLSLSEHIRYKKDYPDEYEQKLDDVKRRQIEQDV